MKFLYISLKNTNMKKIVSITALTLMILVMSCRNDFIDLAPIDSVTVTSLYNTDDDFNQATNGCYAGLADFYKNWWMFGDLRGDFVCDILIKDYSFFDYFFLNVNDTTCATAWRKLYVIVSRVNQVLYSIKDKSDAIIANKARYIAEAEFIRALAYFDLVRIFGDVPMITAPVSARKAYKLGRIPVAEIYDKVIIPDLLDAEKNLPVKYTGTLVGKATSGAAKALLSEVYLTLHDYVKAEVKSEELTKAPYTYALLANYADLFDYSREEHHSEYIFDIEYVTGGLGLGNNFTNLFCPRDQVAITFYKLFGSASGALNFFTHNEVIGNGWNKFGYVSLFDLFPTGDKRKDVTVEANGYTDSNGVYHRFSGFSSDDLTYTVKYLNVIQSGANDSGANWKVYRYADILLMYAEALNENAKTAQALPYLNMVHTRAGLSALAAGMTQAQMADAIALERVLELTAEGHRWFDLVRTGEALNKCAFQKMKSYMTIWPVPQIQIKLYNDPEVFWQNPGY